MGLSGGLADNGGQTGGAGAVSSVFTRTGAVVAVDGDYSGVVASAKAGATAATRYVGGTTSGAPASGTFAVGDFVVAQNGHVWVCTVAGSPGTWVDAGGAGSVSSVFTRTGAVTAADGDYYGVVAAAKTGATQASRYAGATTSGAPASGTFAVGDFVIAQNGHVFICTTAGSPGTWTDAGSVGNLVTSVFSRTGAVTAQSGDYTAAQVTNAADKSSASQQAFTGEVAAPDFAPSGLTGATSAARFVGATASGAPASGTFAVGDFVVARNGHVFVCTSAGSPGTWTDTGSVGNQVTSVFTRTGAVVATSGDYTAAQVTNAADKSSSSQQSFTGEVAAPDFAPSGLTGATSASRYVGATTSGAPASGTFAVGDYVVARNGHIFVCTAAGSPGTWTDVGSVGNQVTSVFTRTGAVVAASGDYTAAQVTNAADKSSGSQQNFTGEVKSPDFVAGGLTGATAASRYAGATASGAPASGTFAVGDFVIDQTGKIWVCTGAGTPGTWTQVAGPDYKVLLSAQSKGSTSNGTFLMSSGGSGAAAAAPGTTGNGLLFYLVAADYAAGAVLNVRAALANGATALTVTVTAGLYPITLSAGNYVIGTVVTGSTVAVASPGANSITQNTSGDFALPSNGLFALGYATSGAPGAATWDLAAQLRVKP